MTTAIKPSPFRATALLDKLFFNSKELQEFDPVFYYGCKSKPRNILLKKNIPPTEYLYANFNARNGSWVISSEECKKAQLLLTKSWVDAHMPTMRDEGRGTGNGNAKMDVIGENAKMDVIGENAKMDVIGENAPVPSDLPLPTGGGEDYHTPALKEYEMAPPLLYLDEKEMFRDADGNVMEIETRGTKDRKGIRFNVKDVMVAFQMPNLDHTLRDDRKQYTTDHYKVYYIRVSGALGPSPQIKKAQYLTYKGILRVLFASNSGTAEKFQDWAEDTLFTHQMGTKDAKVKLGTDLLNITPKTYKAVFDSYASTFPCIYLLRLGTVKDVRSTFGIASAIPDDLSVYKYGFTEDLSRRIKEHASGYGKMNGVSIKLSAFHVIDPKYTSDAEGDVREFVETFQKRLHVEGHSELVSLTDKEMLFVKKQYASIGSRYAGATAELTTQIAELKARIKELENELAAKDLAHANEIQKELYEKKMVEMQRDTNIELFSLKEANYKLELQLLKHTASSGNSSR